MRLKNHADGFLWDSGMSLVVVAFFVLRFTSCFIAFHLIMYYIRLLLCTFYVLFLVFFL